MINNTSAVEAMSVKLEFNTDFTRFVGSESINHTVKVATSTSVVTCSGAILAQHSPALQKLVSEDSELFLDNYSNAQDCLYILHGGSVDLDMSNILDIMKFSVQFGIEQMYRQCLEWIGSNMSQENFVEIFKLCNEVSKFSKMYGMVFEEDVFHYCKLSLKMYVPQISFDKEENETKLDFLKFLISLDFFVYFLQIFIDLINAENVSLVTDFIASNTSKVVKYSDKQTICSIMVKMECCIDKNGPDHRKFINLRTNLLIDANCSDSCQLFTARFFPEGNLWIKEHFIRDKLWKKMESNQILKLWSLFTDKEHFLYSEILLGWIIAKKPSKETFKEVTCSIMPHFLNADYMYLLNEKYKALGYDDVVAVILLKSWKQPSHFMSNCNIITISPNLMEISLNIECRNGCDLSGKLFVYLQPIIESPLELPCTWSSTRYQPKNDYRDYLHLHQTLTPILICPKDSSEISAESNKFFFYGATEQNVHLPISTDFNNISRGNDNCNVKIGILPY